MTTPAFRAFKERVRKDYVDRTIRKKPTEAVAISELAFWMLLGAQDKDIVAKATPKGLVVTMFKMPVGVSKKLGWYEHEIT